MKTKLFIISFFLILLTASTSASVKLSKDATISILTCSPGNELYSLSTHGSGWLTRQTTWILFSITERLILQPKDSISNLHVDYFPTNYRVPSSVAFYRPTFTTCVACIPKH